MKYYFIKSLLLLVVSLIVPNHRVPDIRDKGGPSPVAVDMAARSSAAGTTIARSEAADRTVDRSATRSDKDGAIAVDGIVELY